MQHAKPSCGLNATEPHPASRLSSIAIILFGLCGAVLMFYLASREQQSLSLNQFNDRAQFIEAALERNIRRNEDALHGLEALFASSQFVSRDGFEIFVKLETRGHSGIQAMEWAPHIQHENREIHVAATRKDGLKDYEIRQLSEGRMVPAEQRDAYFPVLYAAPAEGNERVLGFDLGSNAARRAALEKARDTGSTVSSTRITLIENKSRQAGTLLYAPMYQGQMKPSTVQERRATLSGFVLGVFRIGELLNTSAKEVSGYENMIVALYDVQDTSNEKPLHVVGIENMTDWPAANDLAQGFFYESSHTMGQRSWRLVVTPKPGAIKTDLPWIPWLAGTFSFVLISLMGFYIQLMARQRNHAERLALEKTRELVTSEERASVVVENIIDGILTIDEFGTVKSINPAGEEIFGYRSDDVIGRNVKHLMPEPYHSAHDRYLSQYIETGNAKIIGSGREVEGLRSDGTTFPLDLAVAEADVQEGRLFVGIVRDISERKASERLKTEFISTVSHELRTPLTAIRGALGLVTSGATGTLQDKTREMVNLAERNAGRLISLVNDILDLEKIQSGAMEFHFRVINARELLEASVEINEPFAHEHNVSLNLDMPDKSLSIRGDDKRLAQVLANLISNAVKFSPNGGVVTLGASLEGDVIRFRVSDTGPGISKEFQSHIFERFSQVDSTDSREKGGTGLGLSICRSILKKHGGHIGVDSQVDMGSTFFFDLPSIRQGSFHTISNNDTTAFVTSDPSDAPLSKGMRILVLEDDPDVAEYLGAILKNDGYEFEVATSAAQAMEMIRHGDFQMVTVDIRLPDNHSADIIQRIRTLKSPEELSIVVVSGSVNEAREEILTNAVSVTEWLSKPFDSVDLLNAVRRGENSINEGNQEVPRILYVEDDPAMPVFIAELLGDRAQVTVAETLSMASEMLTQIKYDLVLLDVYLPDGSGYELIDVMEQRSISTPIVVFSSDDVRQDISPRVHSIITKSTATNQELLNSIEQALRENLH